MHEQQSSSIGSVLRRCFAAGLVLVAVGCGGDEPPAPHNYKQITEQVFQQSCAFSNSCHTDAGVDQAKFNLCTVYVPDPSTGVPICSSASNRHMALLNLINGKPANDKANGEGKVLVSPCHPENSFILTKLRLPTSATDPLVDYGEHMPKNAGTLSDAYINAISDWIARGAHEDEPDDVTGTACMLDDMAVMSPSDLGDASVPHD